MEDIHTLGYGTPFRNRTQRWQEGLVPTDRTVTPFTPIVPNRTLPKITLLLRAYFLPNLQIKVSFRLKYAASSSSPSSGGRGPRRRGVNDYYCQ